MAPAGTQTTTAERLAPFDRPGPGATGYLSKREIRWLAAIAEAVLPPDASVPPIEVAENVDRYMAPFRARRKWIVKVAVTGVNLYPLLHLKRAAVAMKPDKRREFIRTRFLRAIERAHAAAVRPRPAARRHPLRPADVVPGLLRRPALVPRDRVRARHQARRATRRRPRRCRRCPQRVDDDRPPRRDADDGGRRRDRRQRRRRVGPRVPPRRGRQVGARPRARPSTSSRRTSPRTRSRRSRRCTPTGRCSRRRTSRSRCCRARASAARPSSTTRCASTCPRTSCTGGTRTARGWTSERLDAVVRSACASELRHPQADRRARLPGRAAVRRRRRTRWTCARQGYELDLVDANVQAARAAATATSAARSARSSRCSTRCCRRASGEFGDKLQIVAECTATKVRDTADGAEVEAELWGGPQDHRHGAARSSCPPGRSRRAGCSCRASSAASGRARACRSTWARRSPPTSRSRSTPTTACRSRTTCARRRAGLHARDVVQPRRQPGAEHAGLARGPRAQHAPLRPPGGGRARWSARRRPARCAGRSPAGRTSGSCPSATTCSGSSARWSSSARSTCAPARRG